MFLSVILWITLVGEQAVWVNLDEIYFQKFLGAAYQDNKALLAVSSKNLFQLVLFDFEKKQARILESDGRVSSMGTLMTYEKGFCLINNIGTPKVTFLDENGLFLKSEPLAEFDGWEDGYRVVKVSPRMDGKAWVTFQSWEDKSLYLAILDLKNKTSQIVFQKEAPEEYQFPYWHTNGLELLFLCPQTGQIDLIDSSTFKKSRTLRSAKTPVKRDAKRFKHLSRKRPYILLVGEPLSVDGEIGYFWNKGAETSGESLKDNYDIKTLVQTADGRFYEEDVLTLAKHKGERLVYHWADQELRLMSVTNR